MADITLDQSQGHHHELDEATTEYNNNLKFAVWLYLASEVVLFAILIAAYAVFRVNEPAVVTLVKDVLGIALVSTNTFILLASSYAMVMGLRAIEMGKRQQFMGWIGLTAIMGTAFLGGQYIEYDELAHLGISLNKYDFSVETVLFEDVLEVEADVALASGGTESNVNLHEHGIYASEAAVDSADMRDPIIGTVNHYRLDFEPNNIASTIDLAQYTTVIEGEAVSYQDITLPTLNTGQVFLSDIVAGAVTVVLDPATYDQFNDYFSNIMGEDASNFGMRFYAPTAFHGVHVLIGVLWALYVLRQGMRGVYDRDAIGVEVFGLYWHFVDVVWIVLFTLIYLV